jgi:hypothetical protein
MKNKSWTVCGVRISKPGDTSDRAGAWVLFERTFFDHENARFAYEYGRLKFDGSPLWYWSMTEVPSDDIDPMQEIDALVKEFSEDQR